MEKQLPAVSMRDDPVIKEYLEALFQGGKMKEVNETKELLDYLDTMEQKFTELIEEVASLKETIQTLQNPETRTRLSMITNKLDHALKHTKELLNDTKDNFKAAVKQSLDDFKSKGKHAVIKTVDTLHVKQALQHIGRSLAFTNGVVRTFNGKVAEITAQSRNIKHNFKNIGRIMMGKDAIPYPNDVQKLSVLQRAGTSLFHKIEGLHQKTVSTYKKLDNMGKTSVKKDLKQIENNKANDAKFLEKVLPKENSR